MRKPEYYWKTNGAWYHYDSDLHVIMNDNAPEDAKQSFQKYCEERATAAKRTVYTVISELRAGQYAALKLDRPITERNYSRAIIGGLSFPLVPCYDLPNHIAVESNASFIGSTVVLE